MSDAQLRKRLIRLAHEKPELRAEILPLVKSSAGISGPLYQEVLPAVLDHVESAQEVAKEMERISKTYGKIRTLAHRQKWTEVKRMLNQLSTMMGVVSSDVSRLADEATHYEKWISREGA